MKLWKKGATAEEKAIGKKYLPVLFLPSTADGSGRTALEHFLTSIPCFDKGKYCWNNDELF